MKKEYFIEHKTSMGWSLLRLGEYKNYKECRKNINKIIEGLAMDNYYRRFKMYNKFIQYSMCGLAKVIPFSTKISIKKIELNKIDLTKYDNKVCEFFKERQFNS